MVINLADPGFEPTDEQLQQLSRDAFANVGARNREELAQLRARITAARAVALARLRVPSSSGSR